MSFCGVGTRVTQTSVAAQLKSTVWEENAKLHLSFPFALRMTIKAIYQYKPWRWYPWSVWFSFFPDCPPFLLKISINRGEYRSSSAKNVDSSGTVEIRKNSLSIRKYIDNAFVNSHHKPDVIRSAPLSHWRELIEHFLNHYMVIVSFFNFWKHYNSLLLQTVSSFSFWMLWTVIN